MDADDIPIEHSDGAGDPVPWGALGVLGLTALLAIGLSYALVRLLSPDEVTTSVRAVLDVLPLTLLGAVTVGWVHLRYRAVRRLFGRLPGRTGDWRAGVAWGVGGFVIFNVVIGLALQLLARMVEIELPQPQEAVRHMATDPVAVPWLLLTAVIVAPVAEELYFRGLLFQALRRRLPRGRGIGVSALIFAAAHVLAEPTGAAGLLVFALILPLGILLAWLLERRGTLVTPIVTHATFNLVTLLVLIAGGSAPTTRPIAVHGHGIAPPPVAFASLVSDDRRTRQVRINQAQLLELAKSSR